MKKTMILIFVLLLIIPLTVNAEKVTSLETTVEGKTIKFTGTTDNLTAVACHLYSSSDEDLNQYSYAVDQNSFSGEFEVTADGVYKVSCARYEGGEITTEEVTVGDVTENNTEEATEEEATADKDTSKGKAVKTYDAIKTYVTLAAGAILIIAGALLVIKKRETKKN